MRGFCSKIGIFLVVAAVTWAWDGSMLNPKGGGSIAMADDWDLDLSPTPKKKKTKKKKLPQKVKPAKAKQVPKAAPSKAKDNDDLGLGLEALDVSVRSAEKEAMESALDKIKDKKYADAAVQLWDLYNNPKAKAYFESAEYQLAKSLYRMRMYHSALAYFGQVLDKGVEHKYFRTSLEWLFFISHKITDQSEVLKDIARYADIEFPKKYRDEFLFLLAKYFYFRALALEKGYQKPSAPKPATPKPSAAAGTEFGFDLGGEAKSTTSDGFGFDLEDEKKIGPTELPTDVIGFLSKANALIMQINEGSKFYPKGKYLEGIILYKQANFQQSVDSFKQVVKILHPQKGKYRDDQLREQSFFQLARIHYEHKQFRYSLFYYDMIHRDSWGWLESLFESSWAWFRLGKYQKSLGNLITLDSPFFRDEYFPEGLILKAVTYFENCRYPESNQIVSEFKQRYEPLYKELEQLLAKAQSPEGYYNHLLSIQKSVPGGKSGKMLRRILKLALTDKDLSLLNASVLEIEKEVQRIRQQKDSFSSGRLGQRLVASLEKRKQELMKDAGFLTKRRLEQERDFLSGLMSQALRIKLENDTAELAMLRKAKAGEQDLGPTLLPYDWSAATDDEKLYWPYQGEYWRDELGTYEYTLTWGCRKRVE